MNLPYQILMVSLMVFGFGFVVFFHELGHFLAAKWVGIRVEQFAVGFGQALFAWRKGIGWKVGTTNKELRRRCEEYLSTRNQSELQFKEDAGYTDEQINKAADALGLGETEYRLNWIPLGGYVKMLGQDDLKANAVADDPNAYNRKSIGQRMLVVSAGVIMNIILAAIGFMVVFRMGFTAPPPVVGMVVPNSPAQKAGIQVGDRVLFIDGTRQYDFNRIVLSTALLKENSEVPIEIARPDPLHPEAAPTHLTLHIRPARMDDDSKSFLSIGIGQSPELRSVDKRLAQSEEKDKGHLPDQDAIKPGETIVEIEGKPVKLNEYYKLDAALQGSNGKPVAVTVEASDHSRRTTFITPQLDQILWGMKPLEIAGMEPQPRVMQINEDSSVADKLKAGDVIVSIGLTDQVDHPDVDKVKELASKAAAEGKKLDVTVIRNGERLSLTGLQPATKLEKGKRGMGIALDLDPSAVVSQVVDKSPAAKAKVPAGTKITAVDGKPVTDWFEVRTLLESAGKHTLTGLPPGDQKPVEYAITLDANEATALSHLHARAYASLQPLQEIRKTTNLLEAAQWGVVETRDLLLQFYVTLQRMFQGSVSYTNMMGPIGIVSSGAKIAIKGYDWLIWFLAMISANLAVVNFLPIPIVDGGLFTFLILEKIQGKPLSPKVQAVAQIVGFALIISVFLLVTFQDLKRTIGF